MSYNIRLDTESDGINRWINRRDELIGQIQLLRPAILGLQEVVPGQKADLERALSGYQFLGVPRDDGISKGEYSNLAVDRKALRVMSSGTFWLSPTPDKPSKGWDAAYPRIATWAKLTRRSDGKRFLALNTHLDHVGERARLESTRQITRWLSQHRAAGESLIVTGDFNTEPGTLPIREITSSPLGLRDSKQASRSSVGPEGTFNNWMLVPTETRRIDYVFAGPSLAVERYAVPAWHREGGLPASDHYPVIADLSSCR